MKIYDKMRCDICGEYYKGVFRIDIDGKVSCINCNKRIKISNSLDVKETNYEQIRNKHLVSLMKYDMEEIYTYYSTKDVSAVSIFIDEKGNLDNKKVFFMGNPLGIVDLAHEVAYIGLKYLNLNPEGDLVEDAKYFIQKYLDLREYKFDKKELEDYRNKLEDINLVNKLKMEVN